MANFVKVDWPHYGVLNSKNECAWCDHDIKFHKMLLPWRSPFLERPIAEAVKSYGELDLSVYATPVTAVVIDHLERTADAEHRAKELADAAIEDIMNDQYVLGEDQVWRPKEDAVSPTHYAKLTPQPIQVAHAWNLHHDLATALKYIARYNETQNLRDIEKAKRFLEFFINNVERGDPLADQS